MNSIYNDNIIFTQVCLHVDTIVVNFKDSNIK